MFTTKRTIIAILAVLFTVCFAHLVWSHCHDEPQGTCEDVVNDLDSYKYWYKPSYNTVKYKINVTSHPTEENLTHDVKLAASRWHRMWYDDGEGTTGRIKFGLKYDGTTTTRPSNGNDGVNTIGYGHLSWVHNNWVPAAVFATPYVNDNDRIKDADMLRLCNLCPVGYIPQFFLEPLGQRVTTAFRHLAPTRHIPSSYISDVSLWGVIAVKCQSLSPDQPQHCPTTTRSQYRVEGILWESGA